jgi:large subunit ribosomal protein L4
MPKTMRRLAIRSALSAKLRDERVIVISGLGDIEAKTKAMKTVLAALPESRSTLIVIPEKTDAIERAAGNLDNVWTILAQNLNVRDLLKYDRVLVVQESIAVIEGLWALPEEKRELSSWKQARLDAAKAEEA